jgi:hypothetical protein
MENGENIPTPTQLPSDSEDYEVHQEHTRQLLFEILRERGVNFDSETGKIIDKESDIETLLRVIQNEKKKRKDKGP